MHRATVIGRCEPTTGIVSFEALIEQVMSQQPYGSARRVFCVVDNGSSHRGLAAAKRMIQRWPNCVLVHTPVHAPWLNQIESFSIIQRKSSPPNDFADLTQIQDRLAAFEQRYNATANPFDWKFTADDLNDLLTRIDQHDPLVHPVDVARTRAATRGLASMCLRQRRRASPLLPYDTCSRKQQRDDDPVVRPARCGSTRETDHSVTGRG